MRFTDEVYLSRPAEMPGRTARSAVAIASDSPISRNDDDGLCVRPLNHPTRYDTRKPPSAPRLLMSATAPPATFFGRMSAGIAKNGGSATIGPMPARHNSAYDTQKCD